MTNAHRTITALLAVIAVLLAINLAVTAPSHEVQAQGVGRPVEAVAFEVDFGVVGPLLWRFFSDGTIERNEGIRTFGFSGFTECSEFPSIEWCGWEVIPELPLVP